MEKIEEIIKKSVKELFGDVQNISLTRTDPKFGDFATNVAMRLAKAQGASPREIAEKIADNLKKNNEFSEVSVAGPGFINIRISASALNKNLNAIWTKNYGENKDGAGKTVIVEYPSQNMAKPYSVGHLRPGNQGWAARRLMEVTGWKVISDNHLGDFGSPFGVWVVGFLKFSSDKKLAEGGVYELGRLYIQTKQALKDEEAKGERELADQVQEWLIKLEQNDPVATGYGERFKKISLDHIHNVMNRLKISTDFELPESFFAPIGRKEVSRLLADGVAIKNEDGSVIVPLDEFGIDVPFLVQKSNGASLYATTDIGTILYRKERWNPDRIIHAVGGEQIFYFNQLFAMQKKLGIDIESIHLWFGIIDQIYEDGTRSKMSSRSGVVLMEELLDMAESKAREIVVGRDVSEEDIEKIAIGAIKFSDFAADRRTNILFDWDSIFALGGFSGPYIQYAAVRVNKILNSHPDALPTESTYDYESEKQLILQIIEYPEVVKLSARDLEPHKIATYLYDLARELNRYYEVVPVATSEVDDEIRAARLSVLRKISQVFDHGLSILGIEVPSSM